MPAFITLEGVEGSGKTTQAALLAEFLRDELGCTVALTREPGGIETTRAIRELLADPRHALDPRAELLLFLADRAQHVAKFIEPKLAEGAIVLCDRYRDSTIAYQGYGRGHDLDMLRRLNAWASRDRMPDLTLWIDCDIRTGLARAVGRSPGPGDRFEEEPLSFHERVREGFAALYRAEPERIVRIGGEGSIDEVFARVKHAVIERLGARLRAATRDKESEA